MQRPIALALTVILIIAGGAFLIMNDKSTNTNWPSDDAKDKSNIASSSSAPPSSSGGGSSGGSGSGSISVVPDILHDQSMQGSDEQKQMIGGSDTSGDTDSGGSQEPEKRTTPLKAAPVNTSPSPPSSKQIPSGKLILTESLQYLKNDQMVLAGPKNTQTYPVIKPGTSYSGTIGFSGSLSQADISRLIAYPSPAVVNVPPPATHKEGHNDANGKTVWTEVPYNPIAKPIGSYSSDAGFKQSVDYYISIMGPHIQRKLNTGEWVFTPVPSASYQLDWDTPTFGVFQIRGILKVRYDDVNNTLGLQPNVWYQGDAETGWTGLAFFGGGEPRDELTGLTILGNWGAV